MHVLEITTRIGCKVACSYCPQQSLVNSYRQRSNIYEMSLDTFKKCIDKLPRDTVITFSGYSEPCLNQEYINMISYAHDCNFKIRLFTTTRGIAKKDINIFKKIPFHFFVVHLPDNQGFTRINPDDQYFSIIDELISCIPNISFMFTKCQNSSDDIHPTVKNYLNNKRRFIYNHVMHVRCGNVDIEGLAPHRIKGPIHSCVRLKRNVLLPNGDVCLCCMDFGQKHVIGNLLSSEYEELFKSEKYLEVLAGLKDDSLDILCRYCPEYAQRKNLLLRSADFIRHKIYPITKANAVPFVRFQLEQLKNRIHS